MTTQFDYMFLFWFVSVILTLGWVAHKYAELNPSQKRLIHVESMLAKHIEDAKSTIQAMQDIKESNQTIINLLTK